LKSIREKKQIIYKGKPIKITEDFSTETLKARITWSEVFWAVNEGNIHSQEINVSQLLVWLSLSQPAKTFVPSYYCLYSPTKSEIRAK
jgi:hypothetical protein